MPRSQLDAQGMGYLSLVTTNLTEDGRETNRRAEVIITSTQYLRAPAPDCRTEPVFPNLAMQQVIAISVKKKTAATLLGFFN
ncbi:MAG: hypothetical protein OSA51_02515 [Octadecabacter sp.]|nr:hypothetical protein [Octadecabacter sp.]